MKTENEVASQVSHPLEPLTMMEIEKAVSIVKENKNLGESVRFEQIKLQEPAKQVVLNYK